MGVQFSQYSMKELVEETIDKQKILQRLRQALRPQIQSGEISQMGTNSIAANEGSSELDPEDLALLKTGYDIYHVPLSSARKWGSLIIGVKSLLRKLLRPSLEQQVIYNSANTRLIGSLSRDQKTLKQDLQADLTNRFEEVMNRLNSQSQEIEKLRSELDQLKAMQFQSHQIDLE